MQGLNYFGTLPNAAPIVSLGLYEAYLCQTLLPTLAAIEPAAQSYYQVGNSVRTGPGD